MRRSFLARVMVGLSAGCLAWAIVGPPNGLRVAEVSASCGSTCYETTGAVAYSICGSCTTPGTEESSQLPLHWSVPQDSQQFDVMNEAAWLIDKNNNGYATEAGYFSGWWPYTAPYYWNVGLLAYGTGGNGVYGYKSSNYLVAGDNYQVYALSSGTEAKFVQNTVLFWDCSGCFGTVPTPRYNYSQAEIHAYYTDYYGYPWMNNCSPGEQFTMLFQSSSGGWGYWGNLQLVTPPPPYWATQQSAYQWSNGGC